MLRRVLGMSSRNDVLTAARVNRHWQEIALNMIWSSVSGDVFKGLGRMRSVVAGEDIGWVCGRFEYWLNSLT